MTETARQAALYTMQDALLEETEVIVPSPKRFVREALVMPDGYRLDWYYVDTPPSVMVVPFTADGSVILVRQYRHNLKRYTLECPAGTVGAGEDLADAAARELEEETGFTLAAGAEFQHVGAFCSLPSETNKYTNIFRADPVVESGPAHLDTEIEKYFDMSVVVMPLAAAVKSIGDSIVGTETITALTLASR